MSKMLEVINAFVKSQDDVLVVVPGVGPRLAKVESLVDDVVTVAPKDEPKCVMHYTQLIVQRG